MGAPNYKYLGGKEDYPKYIQMIREKKLML